MNPYEKLGIQRNASQEDVKKAYRELAQKYHTDESTPSPLKEEYEAEMQQIDEAFDQIISELKTGAAGQVDGENYVEIRQLINGGNPDAALSRLTEMGTLSGDAEWNFLMGSAYYFKGWVNQAITYFETACNLQPNNAEYSGALKNVKDNGTGMNGSPFSNMNNPYQGTASGCSVCDMCSALMCANMCCGCGRGGCC